MFSSSAANFDFATVGHPFKGFMSCSRRFMIIHLQLLIIYAEAAFLFFFLSKEKLIRFVLSKNHKGLQQNLVSLIFLSFDYSSILDSIELLHAEKT